MKKWKKKYHFLHLEREFLDLRPSEGTFVHLSMMYDWFVKITLRRSPEGEDMSSKGGILLGLFTVMIFLLHTHAVSFLFLFYFILFYLFIEYECMSYQANFY